MGRGRRGAVGGVERVGVLSGHHGDAGVVGLCLQDVVVGGEHVVGDGLQRHIQVRHVGVEHVAGLHLLHEHPCLVGSLGLRVGRIGYHVNLVENDNNKNIIEYKDNNLQNINKNRKPNFNFKLNEIENNNNSNNINNVGNQKETENIGEPLNETVEDQKYNNTEEKKMNENKNNNKIENEEKSKQEVNKYIDESIEDIPLHKINNNTNENNKNDFQNKNEEDNFNKLLQEPETQKNKKFIDPLDEFDDLNDN